MVEEEVVEEEEEDVPRPTDIEVRRSCLWWADVTGWAVLRQLCCALGQLKIRS